MVFTVVASRACRIVLSEFAAQIMHPNRHSEKYKDADRYQGPIDGCVLRKYRSSKITPRTKGVATMIQKSARYSPDLEQAEPDFERIAAQRCR